MSLASETTQGLLVALHHSVGSQPPDNSVKSFSLEDMGLLVPPELKSDSQHIQFNADGCMKALQEKPQKVQDWIASFEGTRDAKAVFFQGSDSVDNDIQKIKTAFFNRLEEARHRLEEEEQRAEKRMKTLQEKKEKAITKFAEMAREKQAFAQYTKPQQ